MANSVKFIHIANGKNMPVAGFTPGTLYFDANTKTIKLATSATGVEIYGSGEKQDLSSILSRLDSAEQSLSVLTGPSSVTGSVAYQIAEIVAGATEDYDTLQEIADWINDHATSASAMNSAISANTAAIQTLQNANYISSVGATIVNTSTADTTTYLSISGGTTISVDETVLNNKIAELSDKIDNYTMSWIEL